MHDYDVALKSVLRRSSGTVLRTTWNYRRWRTVAWNMLGETADGTLLHIELQSTTRQDMALPMLGYSLAIHRQFRRFPVQMVLYVGESPLRMKDQISVPGLEFRCRMVDIPILDGDVLIASKQPEDSVIAVLTRLRDGRAAVRRILQRIARSGGERRNLAIDELTLLAGLRNMGWPIQQEAMQMPILDDIMDHDLYGPLRRESIRIGEERAARKMLMNMAAKRFGPLSATVKKQIEGAPASKVERRALRLLDARKLEDVLNPPTAGRSAVRARK